MSNAVALRRLMDGGKEAGRVFADALGLGGREARETAVAVIRENPGVALEVLGRGNAGLVGIGASNVLDVIAENMKPKDFREEFGGCISDERRHILLAGRADLFSSAVMVASQEDVIASLIESIGLSDPDRDPGADDVSMMLLMVRSWAMKLMEREDYEEILEQMIGKFTLRQHLLFAVCMNHGGFDGSLASLDVSPDMFEEVGLNPDEARDELAELMEDSEFEFPTAREFSQAKLELSKARAEAGKSSKVLESESVAEDLDIG